MSTSVSKAEFMSEIDPWDEGPHAMYCVYHHVSDSADFYVKTKKAGRLLHVLHASDEVFDALVGSMRSNDRIPDAERKELFDMMKSLRL